MHHLPGWPYTVPRSTLKEPISTLPISLLCITC